MVLDYSFLGTFELLICHIKDEATTSDEKGFDLTFCVGVFHEVTLASQSGHCYPLKSQPSVGLQQPFHSFPSTIISAHKSRQ